MTRLGLALCCALLAGCVTGTDRVGRAIDPRDVASVRIGHTSKQEVLDLFGPPTTLGAPGGGAPQSSIVGPEQVPEGTGRTLEGDVYTYEYREEHELFFSIFLLYTYFDREVLADTLLVGFDESGVVSYMAFERQTDAEPEDEAE